jgi:hypothetical protein
VPTPRRTVSNHDRDCPFDRAPIASSRATTRPGSSIEPKAPARPGLSFIPLCIVGRRTATTKNPATGRPWRGFGARHAEGGAPFRATTLSLSRLATQLSLQKAHSCDLHHIASAMAELASYLSIRTAYAVVRRSSETLSLAHAGLFSSRELFSPSEYDS